MLCWWPSFTSSAGRVRGSIPGAPGIGGGGKRRPFGAPATPLVLGAVERVRLDPEGLVFDARIDTGAETSSMDARDLVEFERNGAPWVRFAVVDPAKGRPVLIERAISRRVRIKRHAAQSVLRPVVSLCVRIGRLEREREFTLADRTGFEFPVLIGRNFLRDLAVVDVSRERTQRVER